jgi:hypothetical protein
VTEPGFLVKWGWSGQSQRRFETFEEALVWLAYKQGSNAGYRVPLLPQLICPDRIDTGSARREAGLTEEQWERVQEVLSWGR